jgi:hypothetical protein
VAELHVAVGEGAIVDQRVGLDRRGGHLRRGCVCGFS